MGNIFSRRSDLSILRNKGEILNIRNFKPFHVEVIYPPTKKSKKISICRCWKSNNYPYCDNSHQKLQQQGVICGPLLLEVRKYTSVN